MAGLQCIRIQACSLRTDSERVEEDLRSQAYTALVELSFAETNEKAAIVERLNDTCLKLNDLIIRGKAFEPPLK